jgi:hypothetical protein
MAVTGLSPAALIVGANAMRTAIKGAQMHTGDPGVGGAANKSSAAMAVPAWAVVDAAGGWDLAAPIAFTGGSANGPAQFVSLWSDASGSGIWYGNVQLTGDLTFDSNGAYTVETLPIAGTSS